MSMSYRLMSVNRKIFLKYKYFNNEVFFLKIAINLIILNSFNLIAELREIFKIKLRSMYYQVLLLRHKNFSLIAD